MSKWVQMCVRGSTVLLVLVAFDGVAQVPPVVNADNYAVNVNGLLSVPAAGGLLSNDTGFDPATHRLESWDARSRFGGVVSVAANGAFTYDPAPGFRGSDDFGYTVRNAFGTTATRVTIEVSGETVWFVNGAAAAGGDGTFNSPFNSFAPVNGTSGIADVDAAGDTIFVYAGSYSVEFDLESGQRLIGHGLGLDLVGSGNDIPAGATPVLSSGSSFPIIELFGSGGSVRGFSINNSSGRAIAGASISGVTLADLSITSTSAPGVIELINSSGSNSFNNVSIDGSTQSNTAALSLINNSGTLNLSNVDLGAGSGFSGGQVLNVSGNSGSISFDAQSTLRSTATRGLMIGAQTATGSVTLPVVDLGGGVASEPLVYLLNNQTGSLVDFAQGMSVSTSASNSHAFSATGGRLRIAGTAALAATAGAALEMDGVELTQNATFSSLSSAGSPAHGIRIGNPVGGNGIGVTGTTTITNPTQAAISVDDSGSPSGFALALGRLSSTGGSFGIRVLGAGVSVSDPASSLSVTAGIGLFCDTGTLNLALATLSAAGAGNGLSFNTCAGTISAAAGTLSSTAGASNDVVTINTSTLHFTYGGTVSKSSAGRAVMVNGLSSPGALAFSSTVSGTNASGGIAITNSSRSVTFSTLILGDATNRFTTTPVQLSGNTGAVNLGVLTSFTNGTPALLVNYANASPGQVSTGAGSVLNVAGSSTALQVSHATNQPLSLQFTNIINTGAGAHGIDINRASGALVVTGLVDLGAKTTAGVQISNSSLVTSIKELDISGAFDGVRLASNSGSFTLLGDGNFVNSHTNGAGGTFSNLGNIAFNLDTVADFRATDVIVNGTGGPGVRGRGVSGTTIFSNVDFNNIGNADNEHVFDFGEGVLSGAPVVGSLEINHSVIENFADTGLHLKNYSGSLNFSFTNNVLRNNISKLVCGGANCDGDGLLLRANGTARINAFILNSVFEDIDGIGLSANPEGSAGARMDLKLAQSAFRAAPFSGAGHSNNGEIAISLRNGTGSGTLNFELFSNDLYNYSAENAPGVVAVAGGDFTTTHGVISDLYIYSAHLGDAVSLYSDGTHSSGSGSTDYDLILALNNVRTPGGTAGSSLSFVGARAIAGSDTNAQISLLNSQFPSSPTSGGRRTVNLSLASGIPSFARACFNIQGNQVAAGNGGTPSIDLSYNGNIQARLQGMSGSGDFNAMTQLNGTNTLGNSASVGTVNSIIGATCTTPTLPSGFPF